VEEQFFRAMDRNLYKKVVIVFLHNNFDSHLLQLRDFKSSIVYPGHWGAFGGSVEEGESPRTALGRELLEEIGHSPGTFKFFREKYSDQDKLNIHMFYSDMDVPYPRLILKEGTDLGVFTKKEILSKNLFSQKLGKAYPIIPLLSELFDDYFEYVEKNIKIH
jgi:8-oxo-dGTP diphosphatase